MDHTLLQLKLSVKVNSSVELNHLMEFTKRCFRQLADDNIECFIKRELMKLIIKLSRKISTFKKHSTISINWFEYHALSYVFNHFEAPNELVLALVLWGKFSQALPVGLGINLS